MPAFKNKLNNTQLWLVSLLVAQANEIPESVKKVLVSDRRELRQIRWLRHHVANQLRNNLQ
jgi:hypothetical protein